MRIFKQFSQSKQIVNVLLIIIAGVLLLIGKTYHEPWRDEYHAWMIAEQAQSWRQLFLLKSYEGHPNLYFSILYIVKNLLNNQFTFLGIHLLPAILCFYILFFKFSFSLFQKILLLFNYYLFYEFGVINRVYIFIFLLCLLTVLGIRQNKMLMSLVCLFLLGITHVQAVPLLIFLAGISIYSFNHQCLKINANTIIICFIVSCSIVFGLWQSFTPSDALHHQSLSNIDWVHALTTAFANQCKSLAPIPTFNNIHCWNTFLVNIPLILLFPISMLLIFVFISKWPMHQQVLFVFTIVLSIVLLAYINGWAIRHFSFLWLALFFGYCIQSKPSKAATVLFVFMLSLQSLAGILLFNADIVHPFSSSKSVATFLKTNYQNAFLIGAHHYTLEPIAYYLKQPIFHLGVGKSVYAMQWKEANMSNHFTIAEIDSIVSIFPNTICILSKSISDSVRSNLTTKSESRYQSKCVYNTASSIVPDEAYEIWHLTPKDKK
jgi:hypothetical protein